MDDQQKTDLDYVKEGARFIRKAGNFDSVLIIASKSNDRGTERYDWVDGNYYAGLKCAELFSFEHATQPMPDDEE